MSKKGTKSRRRFTSLVLILTVVILLLTIRLVEDIGQEQQPGERFTVVRVIDGDTVELLGGDKLRLLAIDTPEKGERFHDEAARLLEKISLGKKARIEYGRTRRDRYGRLLGFLYIDDTLFANRVILDSGLGNLFLFNDQERASDEIGELLAAQKAAVQEGRGLWGLKQDAEDFYLSVKNSFRFHRPGCTMVNDKSEERLLKIKNRQEALFEGLSPCRTCHP